MKRKGPGSAASDRRLANKKRKLEALLALTEAKGKTGMVSKCKFRVNLFKDHLVMSLTEWMHKVGSALI